MVTDGNYNFVPNNAVYTSGKAWKAAMLNNGHLRELLATIKTDKSVIFLDTCYAGKADLQAHAGERGDEDNATQTAITRLMEGTGRAVIAATSSVNAALEDSKSGHGFFTSALLEGLKGNADTLGKDKQIYVNELNSFLSQTVPSLTKNRQVPVAEFQPGFNDFPLSTAK
ncbi:hypothetical protein BCS42_01750 [Crenothrix sp. D3]|nr:hypothetical protein BCS42_01750 [Crenothrix sp. D3]